MEENSTVMLTAKQLEAMHYLSLGHTSKEMARLCSVSPSAIDQRLEGAMRKSDCQTRRQLLRWYQSSYLETTAATPQVASHPELLGSSRSDHGEFNMDEAAPKGVETNGASLLTSNNPLIPETYSWRSMTQQRSRLVVDFDIGIVVLIASLILLANIFLGVNDSVP